MTLSRPTNILVADDDGVMRDLLRDLLTQAGYSVRLAISGSDALAHCTRHGAALTPTSLALLDMNMPRGDGIETCRLLRRLPGWDRVPIVMVTAQHTDGAVRDALEAGVDGFVVKPFSSTDLLKRVRLWTGGHVSLHARSQASAEPVASGHGLADIGIAGNHDGGKIVAGIAWSTGSYSLPSHARGKAQDIGSILRALPP